MDPDRQTIEIRELVANGEYSVAAELKNEVAADVPGCTGLVLPMNALWSKLDELGD